MTGLMSLDRQIVVAGVVVLEELEMKGLGRFFEDALRAFALLENRFDGRARADGDFDRCRQHDRQLVDHR